jgi:hypothetical protein
MGSGRGAVPVMDVQYCNGSVASNSAPPNLEIFIAFISVIIAITEKIIQKSIFPVSDHAYPDRNPTQQISWNSKKIRLP